MTEPKCIWSLALQISKEDTQSQEYSKQGSNVPGASDEKLVENVSQEDKGHIQVLKANTALS